MAPVNVFRWSALVLGVGYGVAHSFTVSRQRAKDAEAAEYSHKESLIAKAKAEWNRLHPAPPNALITDPSDPNFDVEKLLVSLEK